MDLYQHLPEILRIRDELARLPGTGSKGPLGKFIECLELEGVVQENLAVGIVNLIDPDLVDEDYLIYMSLLFGEAVNENWSEFLKREYVKNLIKTIKTKCTTASWHRRSKEVGRGEIHIYELHKSDVEEDFQYSRQPDPSHPYRSARVDIGTCISSCETVCEISCENACESALEAAVLSPSQARAVIEDMGDIKPIHVLVRSDGGVESLSDSADNPTEYLSCGSFLEVDANRSKVIGTLDDHNPSINENLIGIQTCNSFCETSTCQICCEFCLESGCATSCQLTCQAWCETNCQSTCEVHCESACESQCEDTCQIVCQTTCQLACQNACQMGCQSSCQISGCENSCESGGES